MALSVPFARFVVGLSVPLVTFCPPQAAGACDPVQVALGTAPVGSCPSLDANGNGSVDVSELARGIGGASAGSSGGPRTAGVVTFDAGTATGSPGSVVAFQVTLDTGGLEVTGTANDIAFDALAPVGPNLDGDPDCTVNPAIDKDVFTAFQPNGCNPGIDCTGMRAIVISFSNVDAIPDGLLYTCKVHISSVAHPGTYPLDVFNEEAAGGAPNFDLQPVANDDGSIVVPATLDHYKCYKAKDLKNPKFQAQVVSLEDQFASDDAELKKPFLFCNPANKNNEGILNSVDHLACYKIKTPELTATTKVRMVNQLGTVELEAKKPFLLCVPSTKQVLP